MAFKGIKFSLVSTVFNEATRLEEWIEGIENQTELPDEVIITDAGSTDGTLEALYKWQERSSLSISILVSDRCNVAEGRNLAITKAEYDWILSTDFGCTYHQDWIKSLAEHFGNQKTDVVAGAFGANTYEQESSAANADLILQNGYPVNMDQHFTASSRSIAYRKTVWEQLGGYEEWLTLAADDTIFWRRLKQEGFRYQLVDSPYVQWGRHKTYRQFAKEAFRYGLGDGESGINFRNFWSHVIETSTRYLFFLNILLFPFVSPQWALLRVLLLLPLSFGLRSYRNAWRNYQGLKKELDFNFKDFVNSLYLIEISRWFYLKGYLKGWLFASKEVKEGRKRLKGMYE
ncbi:MAG: glycosyltransferase [Cyclobacteriaceae bacterium]